VDAPAGSALHLSASVGFSILAFLNCGSPDIVACGGFCWDPDYVGYRLFAVERYDAPCGIFTFTVTSR
jgi:hypothetical protein